MPIGLIIFICIALLGTWFLLGEKSVGDKFLLLGIILVMYVVYRLLAGATFFDIFAPVLEFFNSRNPKNL